MAKMFNVLDVKFQEFIRVGDYPEEVCRGDRQWGAPARVYMSSEVANLEAERYASECGRKFQLRPVKMEGDAWKMRELARFADGTYEGLPWHGLRSEDIVRQDPCYSCWAISYRSSEAKFHFPHMSERVKGNIAFTENEEKGALDQQTTMKPGRYLKRFYPTLSEHNVRAFANEIIAKYGRVELRFATTEDEIEEVYLNGPSSCMSHPARDFRGLGGYHPTKIYGAGDLAVAYIIVHAGDLADEDPDEPWHASARCLCWPEKKLYGRMYGDTQKLRLLLEKEGYKESYGWYFEGARLLKKKIGAQYIMPYVDGDYKHARIGQDFLYLDKKGSLGCEVQNGFAMSNGLRVDDDEDVMHCYVCDNLYSVDNGAYFRRSTRTDSLVFVCDDCQDNNTFYCEHSSCTYVSQDQDDAVQVGGAIWHIDHADAHAFRSEYSDTYYPLDLQVTMGNGDWWAQEECDLHAEQSSTGEWWPMGSLVTHANGERLHPDEVRDAAQTNDLLTALEDTFSLPAEGQPAAIDYAATEARIAAHMIEETR